jgi:hypothetical protein
MLLVSRTRATLRKAEFGFLGVEVYTRTHTPRFCGQPCSAGLLVLYFGLLRPNLTNWLNVGKTQSPQSLGHHHQQANNPLSSPSDKAQNLNKTDGSLSTKIPIVQHIIQNSEGIVTIISGPLSQSCEMPLYLAEALPMSHPTEVFTGNFNAHDPNIILSEFPPLFSWPSPQL